MSSVQILTHLFLPHTSNNQRAKLLHNLSLFLIVIFLISYQLILSLLPKTGLRILGYAANIPPSEVIALTNEKRVAAGLSPLSESATLSQAAQAKGVDMLNRDYWAHFAPDGTEPWKFFKDAGYEYRYAGENLARDFSNSASAVEAWMNSSSHRENLLSAKYQEIGIAVLEGDLAGSDTTLIVQFFGTRYTDVLPAVPVAEAKPQTTASSPTPQVVAVISPSPVSTVNSALPTALIPAPFLISPFTATKNVSLLTVGLLLVVLAIDGVIIRRRAIPRVSGRTFAHIAFFGMIAAILVILEAGRVL